MESWQDGKSSEASAVIESARSYDDFAFYYELYYRKDTHDVAFYDEIARRCGKGCRILELACGSGRLLIPLLRIGWRITGLDLSEKMLEVARQRVAKERPRLQTRARLVRGDMRDLDGALGLQQFNLIIVAFNSFQQSFFTREDQLAILRSARAHLAPHGLLVVDVLNAESEANAGDTGQTIYCGEVTNPVSGGRVKLYFSSLALPAERQYLFTYNCYEKVAGGTEEHFTAELRLQYIYRLELELLLAESGFSVVDCYGSHAGTPFTPDSERIIMVCQ